MATAIAVSDSAALKRGRDLLRTPVFAGIALLIIYVLLSFFNSPRGFLGTDEGGKVATLIVMTETNSVVPEVGYWASDYDPTARAHGLYYTSVVNGHYVNVTSVPMILAAEPLWRLGGYRMALLLPMAGAIAAAFAGRKISQRVGGDGWGAFWLIGLASPMVIYALDLWEHSLGVGLIAWAAVLLVDAIEEAFRPWRALAAGLLLGLAFTIRSEAAPYAVGFLIVACLTRWVSNKDFMSALALGALAVCGFVVPSIGNAILETALFGETLRVGRATSTVGAGGSDIALRLKEAFVTSLSPFPTTDPSSFPLTIVLVGVLGLLVWKATRDTEKRTLVVLAGLVGFIYLIRISQGVGFVPGLVATTPIAVVAMVLGWKNSASRTPVLLALVPLPLVFAFQYSGGAAPQWAGRYILPTGLILLAVGSGLLNLLERWVAVFMVTASVVIAAFGLYWLSVRTHDVARTAETLEAMPEEILISPDGFVPREFGASYGRKRWLSVGCPTSYDSCDDLDFAVEVAAKSGAADLSLVMLGRADSAPQFEGWRKGDTETVPFIAGTDLKVIRYSRDAVASQP